VTRGARANFPVQMANRGEDPYRTLGVKPGVSDAELRAAYRRLVQLHHPDHNGGSQESARRFEEVQDAYARVLKLRGGSGGGRASGRSSTTRRRGGTGSPPRGTTADGVEDRIAAMERELRAAREARERLRQAQEAARRAAREAVNGATGGPAAQPASDARRPSDEELGYFSTDDSLSKILSDARSELAARFAEVRDEAPREHLADLLDDIAAKLKGGSDKGE
jgi:curved DNA-binding protein CbpA